MGWRMSARNVIDFLRTVAVRTDVLNDLKTRSKEQVIAAAADFGYPFTDAEYDTLVWNLEAHLAKKRGEPFDAHFPLWQALWGQYYLEFLVNDLMPSFDDADFDAVISAGTSGTGS